MVSSTVGDQLMQAADPVAHQRGCDFGRYGPDSAHSRVCGGCKRSAVDGEVSGDCLLQRGPD